MGLREGKEGRNDDEEGKAKENDRILDQKEGKCEERIEEEGRQEEKGI